MNGIKAEPEDEYPSYMNLSENFQSLPSTSSPYFNPPLVETTHIKEEIDTPDEAHVVTDLDLQPPLKEPKKRGRPKKVKEEGSGDSETAPKTKSSEKKLKQDTASEHGGVKKRRDRFNGMPEEEVLQRLLPDILAPNLDILIIGINPGLFAAYVGHHYAGPGNHFWKCLYLSGIIPEPMNAYDDYKLLKYGIGFTNIVSRTTRGVSDLRRNEIREGGEILRKKIVKYRPKIAVFNGKGIYEIFCNSKDFCIGKQPETVEGTDTMLFVMPSSSARCAQLPRAVDKVPFYLALKKLRDYVRGDGERPDESELTFPALDMKVKSEIKFDKDDESNECLSELTLEQIQSRSEYLEALAASAEGREIPAEKEARRRHRVGVGGSDDEDNTLNFEDEESSQSSCSSELQRASQSDAINNQGGGCGGGSYTLSKSLPGSSSFEVIPDVKDEAPFDPYEYGGGGSHSRSPEAQEKEGGVHNLASSGSGTKLSPALSSSLSPSKSSPQLSQQHQLQQASNNPAAAAAAAAAAVAAAATAPASSLLTAPSSSSQMYAKFSPSTSVVSNFCSSTSVSAGGVGAGGGGGGPAAIWQHQQQQQQQHQNSSSATPHGYATAGEMSGEGMSQQAMPPFMQTTAGHPGQTLQQQQQQNPLHHHYQMHAASSPYGHHHHQHPHPHPHQHHHAHHPQQQQQPPPPPQHHHPHPGGPTPPSSSMPMSSPPAPSLHTVGHPPPSAANSSGGGQYKGRPPRNQWLNGSNGSQSSMMMMAAGGGPAAMGATGGSGGGYPYAYGGGGGRGGCGPSSVPSYQGGGSGGAVPKGSPNLSSPTSQRNPMDKSSVVKSSVSSYPSSHVPNFFTC